MRLFLITDLMTMFRLFRTFTPIMSLKVQTRLNSHVAAAARLRAKLFNNEGWRKLQEGKSRSALRLFERAIENDPTCSQAYLNAGNVLFERERFDEAIVKYLQAIKLNPTLHNAYINAALAYDKLGKTQAARECLERVVQLDPKNERAHFYLAQHSAHARLDEAVPKVSMKRHP